MSDIWTVMWKERKLLFRPHGSRFRSLFVLLVPVLVVAIYLPWQEGQRWVESPFTLITGVLIPMILVGTVIPESFAGERERHTLGTLLASRLSDRAILFGKMGTAVGYGWGMTILMLLLSLITVNITHWNGEIAFFTPTILLANLVVSLLLSIMMAGLGILISLRSATVQGTTQALMAITMLPLIVLQIAGILVLQMQRDLLDNVIETLKAIDSGQLILAVSAVLILACLVLLRLVIRRFKRARLILS